MTEFILHEVAVTVHEAFEVDGSKIAASASRQGFRFTPTSGSLSGQREITIMVRASDRGAADKPATPVEPYEDMLGELDMLLLMTVEPGFGGQKFLDLVLPKIRRARALMDKHGVETWLQVDGGVSLETIERCAEAGADTFVAGSAVYSADDPDAMVNALRDRAAAARG